MAPSPAPQQDQATPSNNPRIVIFLTFAIYIRTGREIFRKRGALNHFSSTTGNETERAATMNDLSNIFGAMKTTEITVTTTAAAPSRSDAAEEPIDLAPLGNARPGIAPPTKTRRTSFRQDEEPSTGYNVTISAAPAARHSEDEEFDLDEPIPSLPFRAAPKPIEDPTPPPPITPSIGVTISHSRTRDTEAGIDGTARPSRLRRADNRASWAYTKVAVLFFSAMLITWIPSSANRVYSVVHPGEISFALEYLSSLVLPLQGFWNAVIYAVTSWAAVKQFFGGWATAVGCVGGGARARRGIGKRGSTTLSGGVFGSRKDGSGDSWVELNGKENNGSVKGR